MEYSHCSVLITTHGPFETIFRDMIVTFLEKKSYKLFFYTKLPPLVSPYGHATHPATYDDESPRPQ